MPLAQAEQAKPTHTSDKLPCSGQLTLGRDRALHRHTPTRLQGMDTFSAASPSPLQSRTSSAQKTTVGYSRRWRHQERFLEASTGGQASPPDASLPQLHVGYTPQEQPEEKRYRRFAHEIKLMSSSL